MSISRNTLVRMLASGVLSAGTLGAIAALGRLPYSERRVAIVDALSMPGGVLGSLGSLVGGYDVPSGVWAAASIGGNFLFYAFIWWLILTLVVRRSPMDSRQ